MVIELFENQYQYILRCIEKLLPEYYEEMVTTLYVDDYMHNIDSYKKPIYSFHLSLKSSDIEKIKRLKKKCQKCRNIEDFEFYDEYIDFFRFVEDFEISRKDSLQFETFEE